MNQEMLVCEIGCRLEGPCADKRSSLHDWEVDDGTGPWAHDGGYGGGNYPDAERKEGELAPSF